MQRLSGMDATFLYMETPDMHLHVVGTILLDPSTIPGNEDFLTRLKTVLAERIHLLAPFRERVVQVPFRMDHPVFVEDPNFDLESHIHHIGVPHPGTRRELYEVIGDIASHPLDRSRPLWEMWFIDGLDDGLVARFRIPNRNPPRPRENPCRGCPSSDPASNNRTKRRSRDY